MSFTGARCTEIFKDFVRPDNDTPRQVALLLTIYVHDLYLRAGKGKGDKMTLGLVGQGDEGKDLGLVHPYSDRDV